MSFSREYKAVGNVLTLVKIDGATGARLAGAVFELQRNRHVVYSGNTDAEGILRLRLSPCVAYTLRETAPPDGYKPGGEVYTIHVDPCGRIYVNGQMTNRITVKNIVDDISRPPVINPVIEGDDAVTGRGVPGSAVTVVFPGGVSVTTTVGADGSWRVDVPAGITLNANDKVSAVQREPGKKSGTSATQTVAVAPHIYGYKNLKNLSRIIGNAAGDILEFIITTGNDTSTETVWPEVSVTDVLHPYARFLPGSVRINGVRARYGTERFGYTYDETTRLLTVYLGDLEPYDELVITYRVRISDDWAGDEFNNSFRAGTVPGPGYARNTKTEVFGSTYIRPDN